jgi:hypothetical protein
MVFSRTALFVLLGTSMVSTAVFTPSNAEAYIPSSQTIINRLVKNNGRGHYLIEQEVHFRNATEPLVLREKWIVAHGDAMRVIVTSAQGSGESARYDIVYEDGRRSAPTLESANPTLKGSSVSPEFLETFLHARSRGGFNDALVRAKIVPTTFFKNRPRYTKLEQIKHEQEPLVRLGRTSGVVSWIFGQPTPASAKANPQAWIEQDAFLLRKVRFPSEAEATFDRYTNYPGSLKFPRERVVTWGNNDVLIRVLSAKPLSASQAASYLKPSSIGPNELRAARLPALPAVKEFYTRFR